MARTRLTTREDRRIEAAVQHFLDHHSQFKGFAQALMGYFQNDAALAPHIHFIRYRVKDPEHLRQKLVRKTLAGELIDDSQLFERITDLAGVRIIHLHTAQMREIHGSIINILNEQQLRLVEEPTANCWDIEFEAIFKEIGIAPRSRDSMYNTVHYLVCANQRTNVTCEIQVRTLMDEVWGEVSHRVSYPIDPPIRACQDQLRVLARFTTGCSRLVDSIFQSHRDGTSE